MSTIQYKKRIGWGQTKVYGHVQTNIEDLTFDFIEMGESQT